MPLIQRFQGGKQEKTKDKSQPVIPERHNTLHSIFVRVEGKEEMGSS